MNDFGPNKYSDFSDEQLVLLARREDETAFSVLYERYLPKIRGITYSFYGLGFEADDLAQEAAIGFFTAIHMYKEGYASFSTFCNLCMRRMLVALLRKKNRKKEIPQNLLFNENDLSFKTSALTDESPEQLIIAKEDYYILQNKITNKLSKLEKNVLFAYLCGYDYAGIAEKLCISKKSVDNALKRIRSKMC